MSKFHKYLVYIVERIGSFLPIINGLYSVVFAFSMPVRVNNVLRLPRGVNVKDSCHVW